jgi:hypothetical protein
MNKLKYYFQLGIFRMKIQMRKWCVFFVLFLSYLAA